MVPERTMDECADAGPNSPRSPRLQLRWEPNTGKQRFAADNEWLEKHLGRKIDPVPEWLCHYELVLPLEEHDIRREVYGPRGGRQKQDRTELVVAMKPPTVRSCSAVPCTVKNTGERYADDPIRDGPHAIWDSAKLGGLPIYVVAPDGLFLELKSRADAPLTASPLLTAEEGPEANNESAREP